MGNSSKETAKERLSELIERYNNTLRGKDHKDISEETIRTWLNELLAIFGWDVQNTAQVLQERVLNNQQVKKLREISSTHKKPDYTLMNGTNIKSFLDAKSLDVNIFASKETAFQIRSYGWSIGAPFSIVTNFEQLAIYDCSVMPNVSDGADYARIHFFEVNQYIDVFETLRAYLCRDNVIEGNIKFRQ